MDGKNNRLAEAAAIFLANDLLVYLLLDTAMFVITSYSIHYTKLYEAALGDAQVLRQRLDPHRLDATRAEPLEGGVDPGLASEPVG